MHDIRPPAAPREAAEARVPKTLSELLDGVRRAGSGQERASIGDVLGVLGGRSFGPLVLICGLIAVSPLSGIPGMPTTLGIAVALACAQILVGREHPWLPAWVLRRAVARERLERALDRMSKPARFVDRVIHPRLCAVTERAGERVLALLALLTAATMPPLEVLPFAATSAGLLLSLYGLALTTRDGVLALVAITGSLAGGWFGVRALLG